MENDVNPAVSIGIPVYNGGKYLEQTLNSVLNQTYKNWECVIVENKSNDDSLEIAKKFVLKDNRFKVIENKKFCGLVENWNNAFVHANKKAKYYRLLQADDLLFPEALEVNVKYMEQYQSAGISSSYRISGDYVDGGGLSYIDGFYFEGKEILMKHLKQEIDISGSISQQFFRIESLRKIENYPYIFNKHEYHLDTRLIYEMFNISDVVFTHRVLSYTRRHNQAETSTTVLRFNTFLHGKESRLFRFKPYYPEIEDEYKRTRRRYAYYLFKNYIKGNKECIKWHDEHLLRKITFKEYLLGILFENYLSYKFGRLFFSNKN